MRHYGEFTGYESTADGGSVGHLRGEQLCFFWTEGRRGSPPYEWDFNDDGSTDVTTSTYYTVTTAPEEEGFYGYRAFNGDMDGQFAGYSVRKAECEDGGDNDLDGRTDFPTDPQCTSADDDSEFPRQPRVIFPGGFPPPPDTRKPKTTLGGKKTQDVDKLTVTVTLDEDGTVSAAGTVRVPNSSKVYRFKKASKSARSGKKVKLRLKLSRKGKLAVKRALATGRRLKAKVTITAADTATNSTSKKRSVRLKN